MAPTPKNVFSEFWPQSWLPCGSVLTSSLGWWGLRLRKYLCRQRGARLALQTLKARKGPQRPSFCPLSTSPAPLVVYKHQRSKGLLSLPALPALCLTPVFDQNPLCPTLSYIVQAVGMEAVSASLASGPQQRSRNLGSRSITLTKLPTETQENNIK